MPIGIVLSGGGAKGDFELGALRAMYNRGIRPAVLTGTSVGSLNAVKLAESATSDGPLTELEAIWFGLNYDGDMYVEDPNFAKINQAIKNFMRYNWFTIGYELFVIPTSGLIGLIGDLGDAIRLGIDTANLIEGISAFVNSSSKSLYLLDPIRRKLEVKLNPSLVANSGVVLRMAMVSLETGKVRYVDQSGRFTDDGTSVNLLDATIASASAPAIYPPVPLGSENFVDGGIRDVLPIQAALDAGADQIFAVTASRAGVDPAGSFDQATIVDIAMRAAAEIMSDQIQSYETNPPVQDWPSNVLIIQPDFTVHDSLTIDPGLIRINSGYGYMRAAELVDFARSDNIWDIFLLIELLGLSTAIAKLRLETWTLEYGAAGQPTLEQIVTDPEIVLVPTPELFLQVRENKVQLKALLEERLELYGTAPRIDVSPTAVNFGSVPVCAQRTEFITIKNTADGGMPADFSALWLEFENHPWINPAAPDPWAMFISQAGDVPAATPPPPSVVIEDLQLGTAITSGPFEVSSISTPSVPPGGAAVIAITMGSALAEIGPAEATLTISSNDPSSPSLQVQLIGEFVEAPPSLHVPPGHGFGRVLVGDDRTAIITISNSGCGDAVVTHMDITESHPLPAFSVAGPPVPFSVAANSGVQLQLTFSPVIDASFTASLLIGSAKVSLGGIGFGPKGQSVTAGRIPASLAKALKSARDIGQDLSQVPADNDVGDVSQA